MIHYDELMNVIINSQQIPSKLMRQKLNQLLFDPFKMNDDICNVNEEEYQYLCSYKTKLNCKYYNVSKCVTNNNVSK